MVEDEMNDADRYRWLVNHAGSFDGSADSDNMVRLWFYRPDGREVMVQGKDLDAAISAAEAASLHIEYWAEEDYPVVRVGENTHGWNPLKFNSDALALAVRMEMDVFVRAGRWTEAVAPMGEPYKAMHSVHGDAETATRFAITMAALGKPTGNPADWAGRMRSKLDKLRQYDEAETPMDSKTPNAGINGHCPTRSNDEH